VGQPLASTSGAIRRRTAFGVYLRRDSSSDCLWRLNTALESDGQHFFSPPDGGILKEWTYPKHLFRTISADTS
jgi:hypothetical protein